MSDHGDCNACVHVSEDVLHSAYEICENAAVDSRHVLNVETTNEQTHKNLTELRNTQPH